MSRLNQRVTRRLGAVFVVAMALVWTLALIANDKQQAGSASDSGKSATTTKNDNVDKPSGGGFGGPGFNGGAFGAGPTAGGGAFGGGAGGFGGAPAVVGSNNWVGSGEITLAVSKSGKTLFGYSVRTGAWAKARLAEPIKDFAPNVVTNTGWVVVGKRVYAFSGIVGRWDSIDVADAKDEPAPMTSGDDSIGFESGTKMYMFSAITGRWSVADLSVDAD
jgi:hypothetical protein